MSDAQSCYSFIHTSSGLILLTENNFLKPFIFTDHLACLPRRYVSSKLSIRLPIQANTAKAPIITNRYCKRIKNLTRFVQIRVPLCTNTSSKIKLFLFMLYVHECMICPYNLCNTKKINAMLIQIIIVF